MIPDNVEYLYYCHKKEIYSRNAAEPRVVECADIVDDKLPISKVQMHYRLDFRQIVFIFFAVCWSIYEIFWLLTLYRIIFPPLRQSNAAAVG
jgi:hypothetical protein